MGTGLFEKLGGAGLEIGGFLGGQHPRSIMKDFGKRKTVTGRFDEPVWIPGLGGGGLDRALNGLMVFAAAWTKLPFAR